jgi:endonuclease/exonuclease/phosphatase family metal-dependent hydrolase
MSDKELAKLDTVLCHGGRSDEAASQVNGYQQLKHLFDEEYSIHYSSATRGKWDCKQSGTIFRGVGFGSALMMRNDLSVIDLGSELLNLEMHDVHSRMLQWIVYEKNDVRYLLAHFHGVWVEGNTKGDHAARTQQSLQVRLLLMKLAYMYDVGKIIFGGDFNLDINTEALASLEGEHYRNLIKELGITNTRTSAYRKYGVEGESMHADYVLVSGNVTVSKFEVHNEVLASDHAALVVEFS